MRILLVEDNSDHRELMRLALTGHNSTWEVEAVASGEEALRLLLGGEVFDLVFLDYSLPGRDGLEVLEEIRRGEAPPPVVMVTGRGDEQVAVKAIKGDAYDYVVKQEGYLERLPVVARHAMEAQQLAVERKRAEKALRESEERYRRLVENAHEVIYSLSSEDGTITSLNPAFERITGWSRAEWLGKPFMSLVHPDDLGLAVETFQQVLREEVIQPYELRILSRSGKYISGEFTSVPNIEKGKVIGEFGIARDITERKRAEETLRRAEENFRLSLDDSPLGVRIMTIEGETVYANRAMLNIYRYDSIEELRTTPLKERYTPGSYTESQIRKEKRKRGGDGPSEYEISIVRKNGEILHLQVFRKKILWNGEEQFQVISQDITERKRAEKALRESEERLRTIVEASLDAIIAVNAEGRLVLFNVAAQELFQYSEEEALNQPVEILQREEIGKIHQKRLEKFLNTGVGRCGHIGRRMEKLFRRKDGSLFEAEVSMSGGRLDGLRLVVIAIHDITERKQAEEALRLSEENFHHSLDDSPLGVRIVTIEGETIYANRAMLNIYGYDNIEELKTNPAVKRYTPESFAEYQIRREKRKRGGDGVSEYEISIVRKDGEVRHLGVFRKDILWDGERQFQVIYNDITDRKQAEEALRESEERITKAFRSIPDALIISCLEDGKIVEFNDSWNKVFGYSREEVIGKSSLALNLFSDSAYHQRAIALLREQGFVRDFELQIRQKSGALRTTTLSIESLEIHGDQYVLTIVHDITERKRTEEALRESEEKNRVLFEDVPIESLVVTIEGRIIQYNKAFERSSEKRGRRLPEIGSRMYVDYASNHSIDMRTELIDCINSKTPKTFNEMPYKGRFLNISMAPTREGAIISAIDVTDRKQAEEALHVSEENFRRSMDESPLGIGIVSEEGEIFYANRMILDFFGYESIEELREIPFTKRYMESSYAEFLDRRKKRRLHADDSDYEVDIVRKDGEIRHLQVWRKRVLWNGKEHYQVIYRDITERKREEKQLHASLREKEILLMEVHHRVKNNMQVISGLLDLQARSSGNPELIERLNESQSRIRAMSLVHEKLYGSKDFARIDLAGYVRTLSQDLFQSYKINPGKIDLIVQIDGDVYVDINKAIPCGLILNELISNALKHAFPGDRHGELQIIIRETKNTEIEIVVRDNGFGLPDDVDIHQPRTAGLHLVNGLVKNQLDGQMEVRRDNGTEFRIKFPL